MSRCSTFVNWININICRRRKQPLRKEECFKSYRTYKADADPCLWVEPWGYGLIFLLITCSLFSCKTDISGYFRFEKWGCQNSQMHNLIEENLRTWEIRPKWIIPGQTVPWLHCIHLTIHFKSFLKYKVFNVNKAVKSFRLLSTAVKIAHSLTNNMDFLKAGVFFCAMLFLSTCILALLPCSPVRN